MRRKAAFISRKMRMARPAVFQMMRTTLRMMKKGCQIIWKKTVRRASSRKLGKEHRVQAAALLKLRNLYFYRKQFLST